LPREGGKVGQDEQESINLLAIPEIMNFERFEAVGSQSAQNKSVGTRREWRIKQETGEVRGVSIRERNKERKSVGWLDRSSQGWKEIESSYETWRRTARYAVGTFEQSVGIDGKQPTGQSIRNLPN
jgi:hypothetical protein